ncbi:unnamed protein product [Spodoptera littoralis]|uniref:Peptidase S1 domain-containing protein n=1 Tax=Spodoptera littoralis TaxID=7109 RepID=A0A9P0I7A6_SPOLI|nr:unnamed protein product [Spodoptera littoralis]CAH1641523.1 unnamed protein product [Spodoptera littoralis]
MFTIVLDFVFLVFCQMHIPPSLAIVNGTNITTAKPYYVYLVKASLSERNYDHWLCGGAIVTKDFVITSAACVEDVDYLYVIAGYNKYIVDEELETDECTKKMKKRVIYTCVPVSYNFDFDLLEKWSYIDIALVKVDSPFDFEDPVYEQLCSYKPAIIPINYDPKYQVTNVDTMVMGFGHKSIWREHGDLDNYNVPFLQFSPTLIMDKKECMKEYSVYPNMSYIIEQYMICTLENGNINDKGEQINEDFTKMEGCVPAGARKNGPDDLCEDYNDKEFKFRRNNDKIYYYTSYEYIKRAAHLRYSNLTRRNGICQNDHGGPLVTWVGSREVIIGIASVFKITEENACIGPFLYTSTQCNSAFLDCVLNNPYWVDKTGATRLEKSTPKPDPIPDPKPNPNPTYRRRLDLCDSPPSVKGFDIVRNHISWKDHPSGPAQNELHPETQEFEKPVVPGEKYVRNENADQQYDATQKFAANKQYSGQQYQTNEEFLKQQEAAKSVEKQKSAANAAQYVERQNSAQYAAMQTNTANEQNENASRQRYAVIQNNAGNEQSVGSQNYLRIGNPYEQNRQLDPNQPSAGNNQFQNYQQNPQPVQFDGNQKNPINVQFNPNPPNSAYEQFQPNQQHTEDRPFQYNQQNGMYALNQQNTGKGQQNVANEPYVSNIGNVQYSLNQQVMSNGQFAPNQQLKANEQFNPNQQSIPNGQVVTNQQNTANAQYIYNSQKGNQFAPDTGNLANMQNGPNQQYAVNKQYTANQQVVGKQVMKNTNNNQNIQYYIKDRYHPEEELEDFPSDYRIPPERYQGNRMVARIGDEYGDANYALVNQATMPPQNLPYGYG